jgi:hypothetical protein
MKGERFRQRVIAVADQVSIDRGLLAVNAIAELTGSGVEIYLTAHEVMNWIVGLDYWDTLQHAVRRSGLPGVRRIRARRLTGQRFLSEAQALKAPARRRTLPVYLFANGPTALLAMAALLRVYDRQIVAAAGRPLPKVTRFALTRLKFNPGGNDAIALARTAGTGVDVLPTGGPANATTKQGTLRAATIRAVQAVALSEQYFQ